MVSDVDDPAVILSKANLVLLLIVVHLLPASPQDGRCIFVIVWLLIDVDTILPDPYRLRQQVETNIVTIEHHLNRLCGGRPVYPLSACQASCPPLSEAKTSECLVLILLAYP